MTTVPSLTRTIDDYFTHTWFEIRKQAIDNILDGNVITAALRAAGCFTPQVGGECITRTLRYGTKTATNVKKGDTLTHGEDDIETMARWDWKYSSAHIQRSLMDDQKNAGPSKIKSLVDTKISAAKDALDDAVESAFTTAVDTAGGTDLRADRDPDGLYNILPGGSYYNQAAGTYTYGNVDTGTGNTWWQGKYKTATDPATLNLLAEMRNIFNTCGNNQSYPDLILCEQTLFEIYEDFAQDMAQIVINKGSNLANLGFQVLKFKGADMVWSPAITDYTMLFLNTEQIEVVYDPNLWFHMTEWKPIPYQTERIAHIIITWNMICSELRRQGWLGTYTS